MRTSQTSSRHASRTNRAAGAESACALVHPPLNETASRREREVPFWKSVAYGTGNMAGTTLGYGAQPLIMPLYNLAFGVDPVLIGVAMAVPRVVDLVTDPFAGYLSDSLRPRFGRRAFVAVGSFVGAVFFALVMLCPPHLSQYASFAWLLLASCGSLVGWSLLSVPFQALGYEMTASPTQRTKLMASASFMGQIAALIFSWAYAAAQMPVFHGFINGARWVGAIMGAGILGTGWLCAALAKSETMDEAARLTSADNARSPGWKDFVACIRRVGKCRPFLLVAGAGVLVNFAIFSTAGAVTFYDVLEYIAGGRQTTAGLVVGAQAMSWLMTGIASTPPIFWLSKRLESGRRCVVFWPGDLRRLSQMDLL